MKCRIGDYEFDSSEVVHCRKSVDSVEFLHIVKNGQSKIFRDILKKDIEWVEDKTLDLHADLFEMFIRVSEPIFPPISSLKDLNIGDYVK